MQGTPLMVISRVVTLVYFKTRSTAGVIWAFVAARSSDKFVSERPDSADCCWFRMRWASELRCPFKVNLFALLMISLTTGVAIIYLSNGIVTP